MCAGMPVHSVRRLYAIPRECRAAFTWLMDACKQSGIAATEITFTSSTRNGRFLRAEGSLGRDGVSAAFVVTDRQLDGMSVWVRTADTGHFRVYHERAAHLPPHHYYSLDDLMASTGSSSSVY